MLFSRRAKERAEQYFRDYSGKNYILLTYSCRTALYLSYKALGTGKVVITSPLTCTSAIDPILSSGNRVTYSDISEDSLNIDLKSIDTDKYDILQIIHLGRKHNYDSELICQIKRSGKYVIEDCAQAFDVLSSNKTVNYSDIICYSLIKNAYGIGGGILATDNYEFFSKAQSLQDELKKPSIILIVFRLLRNNLSSYPNNSFFNFFYAILMNIRLVPAVDDGIKNFNRFLKKPSALFFKVFMVQSKKFPHLHRVRKLNAENLIDKIKELEVVNNNSNYQRSSNTLCYSKLFIYNPKIHSKLFVSLLNDKGIEAMHLAQKYKFYYQNLITRGSPYYHFSIDKCSNYLKVHDHLVSLPLNEELTLDQLNYIVQTYHQFVKTN